MKSVNLAHRSLYLFLCGIMGMFLMVTLERSLIFSFTFLSGIYPDSILFNVSPESLQLANLLGGSMAIIAGGWYGLWLGLGWYDHVYATRFKVKSSKFKTAVKM